MGGCHLARGCCCPSSPLFFTSVRRDTSHPPTSHPYLVEDESQRCGGSSTLIHLVGVNLTEWGGCHLARGCCCPSSPLPFTAVSSNTPHPPTSHPYMVRVESQRCGGSSTLIPLVGVNLTEWGGCHLARGCCCPSSPLLFTAVRCDTPHPPTSHPYMVRDES